MQKCCEQFLLPSERIGASDRRELTAECAHDIYRWRSEINDLLGFGRRLV